MNTSEQLVLPTTPFWIRVLKSYKKNSSYLWGLLFLAVLFPVLIVTFIKCKIVFSVLILLFLFSFVFPIVFLECRNLIYSIKISNENFIEIRYLHYNHKKLIIEPFKNIRILEYGTGPGSKTVRNFKIYRDFGKGHRKILINQYEILEWSNQENIERLKQILSKSIH